MGLIDRVTVGPEPLRSAPYAVSRALRRGICGEEALPEPEPEATGGQCACVAYQLEISYTFGSNNTPQSNVYDSVGLNSMFGPCTLLGTASTGTGSAGFQVRYADGCVGGEPTGFSTSILGSFPTPLTIVSAAWTPRFSGPNNCGDQPPLIPPPTRPDVTINLPNFTWVDNSNTTINEGPINITFGFAYIDANANLSFPIEFNIGIDSIFGDINQNGDVTFDFSRNINYGGGGGCDPTPPDVTPNPRNPDDLPLPIIPIPDVEPEQKIIGALVTVNSIGNTLATQIFQDENPTIYAPNIGFINFLIQVGPTSAGWSSDIPIKNLRNVIPCPWPNGAIDVRGTPQGGVQWTLQPLFSNVNSRTFPLE